LNLEPKASLIRIKRQNNMSDIDEDPDQWIQSLERVQMKYQTLGQEI
jgi:hypothetical protein